MKADDPSNQEILEALVDVLRRLRIIAKVVESRIQERDDPALVWGFRGLLIALAACIAGIDRAIDYFPLKSEGPFEKTLWPGEQGCN